MTKKRSRFEVYGSPLDENEPHFLAEVENKKIAEFDDEVGLYGFIVQQSSTRRMNQNVIEYFADGSEKEECASVLFYEIIAENPEFLNLEINRADLVEDSSVMLSRIVGKLRFEYLNQNSRDDALALAHREGFAVPAEYFDRKNRIALLKHYIESYDPARPDLEVINYFYIPEDEILEINDDKVWIYPDGSVLYKYDNDFPFCDSIEGYILNRFNEFKKSSDKRFLKKRLNESDKSLLRLAERTGFSCTYAGDYRTVHLPKTVLTTKALVEKFR